MRSTFISSRRVVVTGMGLVTALGSDLPSNWERILAGENGIGPISFFDASEYATKVAAEARSLPPTAVKDLPREDTGLESIPSRYCRRSVQLFLRSVREAYADSRLAGSGLEPKAAGVVAGTSVNYVHLGLVKYHYQFKRPDAPLLDMARFAKEGLEPQTHFFRRMGDLMSVVPAKALNLAGPNIAIDTACAASASAVGEAFRIIRRGDARVMVAGGSSALVNPLGILAFSLLGALSRNPDPDQASRPFDRCRDGFVMGEGAGAVILEDREHALGRGAPIYGEIAGFGATANAHNLTDPSPDGICEENAMRLALKEGSLQPEDIDYIAAHGTSTPKNDAVETAAIKRVFGPHARRLMVSSSKGQIGHTISAAGICNLVLTVKAMNESRVPPTAHHQNLDPACDLDYVPNESRRAIVRAALVNAFAFGGQNAVVALRAA